MSWPEYVRTHLSGRTQASLAGLVGVSATAVSRWLKGEQGVDAKAAVEFARRVGDKPLNALVAAGVLRPDEARQRASAAPALDQLSDEDLLDQVAERMRRGRGGSGNAAPNKVPPADGSAGGEVLSLRPDVDPGYPEDAAALVEDDGEDHERREP